jgi:hypothetical protein
MLGISRNHRESGGMRYKFTHASQSMADSLEHPGKQ